jgi:hypothetical protein
MILGMKTWLWHITFEWVIVTFMSPTKEASNHVDQQREEYTRRVLKYIILLWYNVMISFYRAYIYVTVCV